MAVYTRNELNIRTTGNFLLACASNLKECRPFLRKYYNKSIRLPSDWIDVAEQYQVSSVIFINKLSAFINLMIVKLYKKKKKKKKDSPKYRSNFNCSSVIALPRVHQINTCYLFT